MRKIVLAAALAALAGCSSGGAGDALDLRPSAEIVGAIPKADAPAAPAYTPQQAEMPPPLDTASAEDGILPLTQEQAEDVEQSPQLDARMAPDILPQLQKRDAASAAAALEQEAAPGASGVSREEAPRQALALAAAVPNRPAPPRVAKPDAGAPAVVSPRAENAVVRGGARRTIYKAKFGESHPVKFAGGAPHGHEVHGIDISKYQGRIDWATARKGGVNFAFIKATEGKDHLDETFRRNWDAAAQAGVPRGAYHFYWFCSSAEAQAKWFIRNVPKDAQALPPVLDVEWNSHSRNCRWRPTRAKVIEKMQTFMSILERHYGKRPIIYTTPDFYKDNLQGQFKNHTFWLRSVKAHPRKLYPNRTNYGFWQYSGTGRARGITGNVDLNVFNGDAEDWHRWLAKNGL
ncbi:MAG TPA: GH25 family lysozyme [Rhizobiaceae bacterium]|nr:GH25 family lysozyme [Rhizobiaceae bacterium]